MANIIPELSAVQSETLQSEVRRLLPSQQGFGTDLVAQNVIVPVIDLTSAAEGSSVGVNLQTALAFGSQTFFEGRNSTDVIANTAGFYRILGTATVFQFTGAGVTCKLEMSDGLSTKTVYALQVAANPAQLISESFDLVVFLRSGDSISAVSNEQGAFITGSSRQIADVNGVLVNPSGFSPQ